MGGSRFLFSSRVDSLGLERQSKGEVGSREPVYLERLYIGFYSLDSGWTKSFYNNSNYHCSSTMGLRSCIV